MRFTYDSYEGLIRLLKEYGYVFTLYSNWNDEKKKVIFRHDVDFCIEKAKRIAEIDNSSNIHSSFFFLISSDLYNIYSKTSSDLIKYIRSLGHDIGLHFDEMRYPQYSGDPPNLSKMIVQEAEILGDITGEPIKVVSMHRPSRCILESNIEIPGIINSYSKVFYDEFKYVSDSRRTWREPVREIIKSGKYDHIQVLTHPFWYNEIELSLHDSIASFINTANRERYCQLNENISDLSEIMEETEIN